MNLILTDFIFAVFTVLCFHIGMYTLVRLMSAAKLLDFLDSV